MKKSKKILSGLMGGAALLSQAATVVQAEEVEAKVEVSVATDRDQVSYQKVVNVTGEFSFDQNVITPPSEVFNLFGTAATAMCAKPSFAFGETSSETYYVNISGDMKESVRLSIEDIKKQVSNERVLKCSCGMSGSIANVSIVGVPLKNVLQMVELSADANTVTIKDGEGYGLPIPLDLAIERDAMLVYQIGGKDVPETLQLWMPSAAANYFTRGVMRIEVTHEDKVPEMQSADDAQRAKIAVLNNVAKTFAIGDQITFEGYADDYDVAIAAIEFSMDGGETWTACATEGATTDKWVYWYFTYETEAAGTYKLDVRARTAEGPVSPLASSVVFTVE